MKRVFLNKNTMEGKWLELPDLGYLVLSNDPESDFDPYYIPLDHLSEDEPLGAKTDTAVNRYHVFITIKETTDFIARAKQVYEDMFIALENDEDEEYKHLSTHFYNLWEG